MVQTGIVTRLRRYKTGANQRSLDVLRAASADDLVFDLDERASIRALIEGALLRHHARQAS